MGSADGDDTLFYMSLAQARAMRIIAEKDARIAELETEKTRVIKLLAKAFRKLCSGEGSAIDAIEAALNTLEGIDVDLWPDEVRAALEGVDDT